MIADTLALMAAAPFGRDMIHDRLIWVSNGDLDRCNCPPRQARARTIVATHEKADNQTRKG
jgi:hypothetical protein